MLGVRGVDDDSFAVEEVGIRQDRYVEYATAVNPGKAQVGCPQARRGQRCRYFRHTGYQGHRQNPEHPGRDAGQVGDPVNALGQQYAGNDHPQGNQDEHHPGPAERDADFPLFFTMGGGTPVEHEPHADQVHDQRYYGSQPYLPDVDAAFERGEDHGQAGQQRRQQDQVTLLGSDPLQEAFAAKEQRHHAQREHVDHVGSENVPQGQLRVIDANRGDVVRHFRQGGGQGDEDASYEQASPTRQ